MSRVRAGLKNREKRRKRARFLSDIAQALDAGQGVQPVWIDPPYYDHRLRRWVIDGSDGEKRLFDDSEEAREFYARFNPLDGKEALCAPLGLLPGRVTE